MTAQAANTPGDNGYIYGQGSRARFNYGVVSAGPAAELATIMSQLVKVYEELMSQWEKMANTESNVQAQTALISARAQRDAAQQQASATRAQAWQEGVSAFLSVAQMGVQFAATNSLSNQMGKEQTELHNLNNVNDSVQAKMTGTGNLGEGTEITEMGNTNPDRNPDVVARINEMKAGRLTATNTQGVTDEEAISAANGPEITEIKQQLDNQISNQYEAINSKASQIQQRVGYVQMFGQGANGLNGAIAQGIAANHQTSQGFQQGLSTIASTASQMAGNAQNQASAYVGKYYDMIAGLIAQFRSGAQAYPQG